MTTTTGSVAAGMTPTPRSDGPQPTCPTCGGDGFTFHYSPTNGAIELDGPCPTCRGAR